MPKDKNISDLFVGSFILVLFFTLFSFFSILGGAFPILLLFAMLQKLSIMNNNGISGNICRLALFEYIVHFENDMIKLLLHAADLFLFVENSQLFSENRFVIFIESLLILLLCNIESVSFILFFLKFRDEFVGVDCIFLAILSKNAK